MGLPGRQVAIVVVARVDRQGVQGGRVQVDQAQLHGHIEPPILLEEDELAEEQGRGQQGHVLGHQPLSKSVPVFGHGCEELGRLHNLQYELTISLKGEEDKSGGRLRDRTDHRQRDLCQREGSSAPEDEGEGVNKDPAEEADRGEQRQNQPVEGAEDPEAGAAPEHRPAAADLRDQQQHLHRDGVRAERGALQPDRPEQKGQADRSNGLRVLPAAHQRRRLPALHRGGPPGHQARKYPTRPPEQRQAHRLRAQQLLPEGREAADLLWQPLLCSPRNAGRAGLRPPPRRHLELRHRPLCHGLWLPALRRQEHQEGTYEEPKHMSVVAKDLISKILKFNPSERMSIGEIRQHPFCRPFQPIVRGLMPSQSLKLDEDIAQQMNLLGYFSYKTDVENHRNSQNTVAYYLLLYKKLRESKESLAGYFSSQFREQTIRSPFRSKSLMLKKGTDQFDSNKGSRKSTMMNNEEEEQFLDRLYLKNQKNLSEKKSSIRVRKLIY